MADKIIAAPVNTLRFAVLILLCGLGTVCNAVGASITVFNTGEGPGRTALPVGQVDPNYVLVSAPSGVPLGVITSSPNGSWTPNTTAADWINPYGSGSVPAPVGNYNYETTFTLAGLDSSTAELSGRWTSDNDACIYLNGVSTGICTGFASYGSLVPFSITSGFQPGVNTLNFIVTNTSGAGLNPTGVIAEISGTASSATPEPSSLLLLGAGFVGLVSVAFRHRKLN